MQKLIYRGPSKRVRVPGVPGVAVHGEPFDVPDVLAPRLIAQGTWEPAPRGRGGAKTTDTDTDTEEK